MDDAMKGTIETLISKVESKARELAELKRTINFLAREAGGEPIYVDESGGMEAVGGAGIRADQYYGKSPITAAREYLESRGRAVQVGEILAALERGGFGVVRVRSSHHFLQHSDGRKTVVPVHKGDTIGPGLMGKILRDCGLDREQFRALLG